MRSCRPSNLAATTRGMMRHTERLAPCSRARIPRSGASAYLALAIRAPRTFSRRSCMTKERSPPYSHTGAPRCGERAECGLLTTSEHNRSPTTAALPSLRIQLLLSHPCVYDSLLLTLAILCSHSVSAPQAEGGNRTLTSLDVSGPKDGPVNFAQVRLGALLMPDVDLPRCASGVVMRSRI